MFENTERFEGMDNAPDALHVAMHLPAFVAVF